MSDLKNKKNKIAKKYRETQKNIQKTTYIVTKQNTHI
jgi:hypothetical protein